MTLEMSIGTSTGRRIRGFPGRLNATPGISHSSVPVRLYVVRFKLLPLLPCILRASISGTLNHDPADRGRDVETPRQDRD